MRRALPAVLAAVAAAVLVATAGCGREEAPVAVPVPAIGGRPADEYYVRHDLFLAADDPEAVPAPEATFLEDDDEVFGVVVAGHARAYPVPMIAYHHVVNDVIEGIPVAVTY